jgi:hypothetical protein
MSSDGSTTFGDNEGLVFHLRNTVHRHSVEESYRQSHSHEKRSNLVLWLPLHSLHAFCSCTKVEIFASSSPALGVCFVADKNKLKVIHGQEVIL